MKALELRIPPPVVALACAFLMWLVARNAAAFAVAVPGHVGLAIVLAAAGIAIDAAGILAFRKAKTTINPLHPDAASTVVDSGIFRVTRNPMYLGMLLVLAGWAVYLSNVLALLGLPAFILYMNRFQIGPEERMLAAKFGATYEAYRSRVRRWI